VERVRNGRKSGSGEKEEVARRRKWREGGSGELEEKYSIIKIQNVFSRYESSYILYVRCVRVLCFPYWEKTC
jgi:hypothetical protein